MDIFESDMQYKVPQDVQREDTIIGPITLRQLIMLAIGGGIAYALYVTLARGWTWQVWLPPVAIVSIITLAFTFLKVHGLSFHIFLMNFIEYKVLPQKRFWIQGSDQPLILKEEKKKEAPKKVTGPYKKQKSIEELTNILDSHGKPNPA